jgi:predicted DNA binding CopG/RHH family protein
MKRKIEGTTEAWESGELGRDPNFVESVQIDTDALDEALELQMISIRLQKSLLEDFKLIAKLYGIGYQPLMKQVLKRFVDCEKKQLLHEYASRKMQEVDNNNKEEIPEKKAC